MFLKLIFLILFAITAYSIQPVFAVDDSNEILMPKGMWKDPATGLIWDRCSIGQVWNGTTCAGEAKKYNWKSAIAIAKQQKTGGYTDWQLPTILQLRTLVRCDKGFSEQRGEWVIPATPFDGEFNPMRGCKSGSQHPTIDQQIFPETYHDAYLSVSPTRSLAHYNGAWGVAFDEGAWYDYNNNYSEYVRAVRTSQSLGREGFLAFFEQEIKQETESQKQEIERQQRLVEQESKRQQMAAEQEAKRQQQEAKRQAQIRADEEIRKAADERALQAVLTHKNPQVMYLAAGKYEREGKQYEARQVYEQLIERFPSSSWAIKANDQLLQSQRVDTVTSSARNAASEANNRAYKACQIEMDSCYSRNGSNCYRDCKSLR